MSVPHTIHDRLFATQPPVPRAQLTEVIQAACQTFHRVVGASLGSKYQRVPVYLVDDWVTDALGVFSERSQILAHTDHRLIGADEVSKGAEIEGFGVFVELFDALREIESLLGQAKLLDLAFQLDRVALACMDFVAGKGEAEEAFARLGGPLGVVKRSLDLLGHDPAVSPYLSGWYPVEVDAAVRRLGTIIEKCKGAKVGGVPGVSFEQGRRSGLLLANIPELGIDGPAILVAPGRIATWTEGWPAFEIRASRSGPGGQRLRVGGWRDSSDAFLVAVGNVVQHELTHAMLRVRTDHSANRAAVARAQDQLYRDIPDLEEGIANFVAYICTATSLIEMLGDRKRGRDEMAWMFDELHEAVRSLHADYHEQATDDLLCAWRGHRCNLGAFAGFISLFATDTAVVNWPLAFSRLPRGEISTAGM